MYMYICICFYPQLGKFRMQDFFDLTFFCKSLSEPRVCVVHWFWWNGATIGQSRKKNGICTFADIISFLSNFDVINVFSNKLCLYHRFYLEIHDHKIKFSLVFKTEPFQSSNSFLTTKTSEYGIGILVSIQVHASSF